jgi:hypothetical protein
MDSQDIELDFENWQTKNQVIMKDSSPKLEDLEMLNVESVEVALEHFQNDIDFLNLINEGMTTKEFNDLVAKIKSA